MMSIFLVKILEVNNKDLNRSTRFTVGAKSFHCRYMIYGRIINK